MTPRRSWLEDSTDVVVDELARFDLIASRAHVSELIRQRVTAAASGLNIKEQSARRYLHEEALRELAREAAVTLADEQPGANLHQLPRTIPMALQVFGLSVAALAEAAHLRELNADAVGVHGALEMISLFAQLLYELPEASGESLLLPRAALTRTARLLDASAQMVRDGAVVAPDLPGDAGPALADAFARDASTLRSLLGENDGRASERQVLTPATRRRSRAFSDSSSTARSLSWSSRLRSGGPGRAYAGVSRVIHCRGD